LYSYGRNPTLHFSYGLVTVNGCIKAQGYNPRRKLAARRVWGAACALPCTLYRKGTTPAENWRRGVCGARRVLCPAPSTARVQPPPKTGGAACVGRGGVVCPKRKGGVSPAFSFAMRFYSASGLNPIFSAFACTFFMAFCTA
jgi:hypothetical protein